MKQNKNGIQLISLIIYKFTVKEAISNHYVFLTLGFSSSNYLHVGIHRLHPGWLGIDDKYN
jgi:hypothetical protein